MQKKMLGGLKITQAGGLGAVHPDAVEFIHSQTAFVFFHNTILFTHVFHC